MADGIGNEHRGPLQQRPVLKYGLYVMVLAVLVAEIGVAPSAWLSAQTATGLTGGIVLVGTASYLFERTTLVEWPTIPFAATVFSRHC